MSRRGDRNDHDTASAGAEEPVIGDAQGTHGRFDLGLPDLSESRPIAFEGLHLGRDDLSALTTGGGQHSDLVAVGDQGCDRASRGDRLIVGMSVDEEDARRDHAFWRRSFA